MITRKEVQEITTRHYYGGIRLSQREFEMLATAALKARYTHINKKADTDPLYECGMDYLEETEL